MKKLIFCLSVITSISMIAIAQGNKTPENKIDSLERLLKDMKHRFDILEKQIDDVLWFQRVGDICTVDKVFIYGPPAANIPDSSEVGALNPVRFWSYVFIPHSVRHGKKYPLIILPHGGVHSNFSTYYTHIIRELMVQGYIVIAPEYRGSTGYGKKFYELIDYGGLETGDTDASRQYMIENYPFVDSDRVGIMGWSHGGMIALMCLFHFPEHYKVGFAGVPVSDLIMRIGYRGQQYEKYFSASYHIGQTVEESPDEYRRRSPVSHAAKLRTPLLVHTNTNDDDVYAMEVIELIKALKDADRDFVYDIYEDLPGGHGFDRIDTRLARTIRFKMYQFLAAWLNPPHNFRNVQQLEAAAYPGMKPQKSRRKR